MAAWDGATYERVLQDVIERELEKGPCTLETISKRTLLNGEHPSTRDLKEQADYLIKHSITIKDLKGNTNSRFYRKNDVYYMEKTFRPITTLEKILYFLFA